jgi:hypothetical protein
VDGICAIRDRENSPANSGADLIWNCVQRQRRGFIPSLGSAPGPIKPKPPALKAHFINSENGIDLSRAFRAVMLLIRFLGRLPQASGETPPSAVAERNVTNGIATLLWEEMMILNISDRKASDLGQ